MIAVTIDAQGEPMGFARARFATRWTLVLALLAPTLVGAQSVTAREAVGGDVLWMSRYNGPVDKVDSATDVAASPDGSRIFVTGSSTFVRSIQEGYMTIAYDALTGAALWGRRYKGPGDASDIANAIAVSPDGSRVFVTGESFAEGTFYDYATLAYDAATGRQLWAKRYNGPEGEHDLAKALAVSPDGSKVFVTGESVGDSGGYEFLTVTYDAATGARLWARRNSNGEPFSIAASADGARVFVTGVIRGMNRTNNWSTIAYDASTGTWLWTRGYDGIGGNLGDEPSAVVSSPDGETAFVTGRGAGTSTSDFMTIAYEASTGVERWGRRADGGDFDIANAMAVSADGSTVFVTGRSDQPEGLSDSVDYLTVAYDASNGSVRWARLFDAAFEQSYDYPVAIAASSDGEKVFVTGLSDHSPGLTDYLTIAYDAATGSVSWARRLDGLGSHDYASAIVVGPDGSRVFVTGTSSNDMLTVAYEA